MATPASRCCGRTEATPARNSSAIKAEVYSVSPQKLAMNSKDGQLISTPARLTSWGVFNQFTSPSGSRALRPKYQKNNCTSSGVLRNSAR